MTLRASCHCGAVILELDAVPDAINECLCSICRRYGARWAYYRPDQVRIGGEGGSDAYVWGDRMIGFRRCRSCGCMTHWQDVDPGARRLGVNTRMLDPDAIRDVPVYQSAGPEG